MRDLRLGADDGSVPDSAGRDFHDYESRRLRHGTKTVLPQEIVTAVEDCGFSRASPMGVTLIGGLFITVLSFIMIMSVYGRFSSCTFIPQSPCPSFLFAGEPSQNVAGALSRAIVRVP